MSFSHILLVPVAIRQSSQKAKQRAHCTAMRPLTVTQYISDILLKLVSEAFEDPPALLHYPSMVRRFIILYNSSVAKRALATGVFFLGKQ